LIAFAYSLVIAIGLLLIVVAWFNLTISVAAWCAIYPSVAMMASLPGLDYLPASRLVTALLCATAVVVGLRDGYLPRWGAVWAAYAGFGLALLLA